MPTGKAPCPVCSESVRTDMMPKHIANHKKLVPHLMSETDRKKCCDMRVPYFYEPLGNSYKYIVCLICKTGHTCVNNGSAQRWIAEHRFAKACHSKFDDVRSLYAIDGPIEPMPPVVEMMTRPSHTMMDNVYKTFGFLDADKCLSLDEQLRIVCMKYQQRNAAPPHTPAPPERNESLEQAKREAEVDRQRIQAEREAERLREQGPPLPTRNVLTLLVDDPSDSSSEDDTGTGPDEHSRGIIEELGDTLRYIESEGLSRKDALCDERCEEAYLGATNYINYYEEQHDMVQQVYDIYTEFINGDIPIEKAIQHYNSITKSL